MRREISHRELFLSSENQYGLASRIARRRNLRFSLCAEVGLAERNLRVRLSERGGSAAFGPESSGDTCGSAAPLAGRESLRLTMSTLRVKHFACQTDAGGSVSYNYY